MRARLLLLAALGPLCWSQARAHQASVLYLTVQPRGREVIVIVRGTRHDLAPALGVATGVRPLPRLYLAKRDVVTRNVASYITVGGARPCEVAARALRLTDHERKVVVTLRYHCTRRVDPLHVRYDLLFDQDPLHRALVTATGAASPDRRVLDRGHRELTLSGHLSAWDNAADFFVLGIEHIFTGYDHVMFLLGLLLAAGLIGTARAGLLYLLKVVTSFTVAHSVTLICAALGWVSLGPHIVEPAIAATIAYVGIENLRLSEASLRRRWVLTFAFGLVHGFGFAYILREVGLPARGLVLSLLCFNLGVEVGQATLVVLMIPLVHLLARGRVTPRVVAILTLLLAALLGLLWVSGVALRPWHVGVTALLLALGALGSRRLGYRRGVLFGGSLLIAMLGLFWLGERLAGVTLLRGYLG